MGFVSTKKDVVFCACCGRQIVPGSGTPDRFMTYGPVKRLWSDQWACAECDGLDENGLFPEEAELEDMLWKRGLGL